MEHSPVTKKTPTRTAIPRVRNVRRIADVEFTKKFDLNTLAEQLAQTEATITHFDEIEDEEGAAGLRAYSAILLRELGRVDEAICLCDDVYRRYRLIDKPEVSRHVVWALAYKCLWLFERADERTIAACDDLLGLVGSLIDPQIAFSVAQSLVCKGVMLGTLDRTTEALASFEEVIEAFGYGRTSDPELLQMVETANKFKSDISVGLSQKKQIKFTLPAVYNRQGSDVFGTDILASSPPDNEVLDSSTGSRNFFGTAGAETTSDLPVHPGVLLKQLINDEEMTVVKMAETLGITRNHLHVVLRGDSGVTAEMAAILEERFGTPALEWCTRQAQYDLAQIRARGSAAHPKDLRSGAQQVMPKP